MLSRTQRWAAACTPRLARRSRSRGPHLVRARLAGPLLLVRHCVLCGARGQPRRASRAAAQRVQQRAHDRRWDSPHARRRHHLRDCRHDVGQGPLPHLRQARRWLRARRGMRRHCAPRGEVDGNVHFSLLGSSVRQDGKSASLTAPSGVAQQACCARRWPTRRSLRLRWLPSRRTAPALGSATRSRLARSRAPCSSRAATRPTRSSSAASRPSRATRSQPPARLAFSGSRLGLHQPSLRQTPSSA